MTRFVNVRTSGKKNGKKERKKERKKEGRKEEREEIDRERERERRWRWWPVDEKKRRIFSFRAKRSGLDQRSFPVR